MRKPKSIQMFFDSAQRFFESNNYDIQALRYYFDTNLFYDTLYEERKEFVTNSVLKQIETCGYGQHVNINPLVEFINIGVDPRGKCRDMLLKEIVTQNYENIIKNINIDKLK